MLISKGPIPGITAGTNRARSGVWERVPGDRGGIIFDHQGAPCTDSRYYRHCRGRLRGVLSKSFGSMWTWTAILPRSRCCADRAGGDTKTPRSRRALQLAQIAAGALRE